MKNGSFLMIFMWKEVQTLLKRSVDGIFIKINKCWFFVILVKFSIFYQIYKENLWKFDKIMVFEHVQTLKDHRFMNFWNKDNSSDKKTPNNPNCVSFIKNFEFVCFPPKYGSQKKKTTIFIPFKKSGKNLGNRQTMKKKIPRKIDKLLYNIYS